MKNNHGYFVKMDDGREPIHWVVSGPPALIVLHDSTSPEVIHARHSDLVRRAHRIHKTPEAISDAIDLPVSIVKKHLIELGYLEPPEPAAKRPRKKQPAWTQR